MKNIRLFKKYYCLVLQLLISFGLLGLVCINICQVITRYTVDIVVLWIEDVTVLTMLWMGSLGVGWLWAKHELLSMDVADYIFPKAVLHVFDYILEYLGLGVGVGLVYISARTYRVNSGLVIAMTRFDEKMRYLPMIVGGVLIFISSVLRLIELYEERAEKKKGGT